MTQEHLIIFGPILDNIKNMYNNIKEMNEDTLKVVDIKQKLTLQEAEILYEFMLLTNKLLDATTLCKDKLLLLIKVGMHTTN
jgi:hypothetical protein